jgi:hypothetical protein
MSINGINSAVISDSEQEHEIYQAHDALIGAYIGSGMLYSGTMEYSGQILESAKNLSGTQSKALLSRFKERAKRLEELNGEEEIRAQQVAIVFRAVFHDDTVLPESPVILFPHIHFASNNNKADPVDAPSQSTSASSSLATEQDAAWVLAVAMDTIFRGDQNVKSLVIVRDMLKNIPPSNEQREALRSIGLLLDSPSKRSQRSPEPVAADHKGAFAADDLQESLTTSRSAIAGQGIDNECPFTDIAARAEEDFRKSGRISFLEGARTLLQEMEEAVENPADKEAIQEAINHLGDAIADAMLEDLPS